MAKAKSSKVAESAAIEHEGETFRVAMPAHEARLIELGWTHVGVDEEGRSFFETRNEEAVRAAQDELGIVFSKKAKAAL